MTKSQGQNLPNTGSRWKAAGDTVAILKVLSYTPVTARLTV